jgi:cytochrome c553
MIAVIVVMSFSTIAFAEGPDTIELPASMGKITFHHRQHQERLKDCTMCHATKEGGKIENFGKDIAHKTCKGCHQGMSKGPTSCKDCHHAK